VANKVAVSQQCALVAKTVNGGQQVDQQLTNGVTMSQQCALVANGSLWGTA